eukprot:CAMPEP_0172380572 /NCGR_PEP_ID=MMETSP1060-20121228/70507_1 /TAXON_ID=37318 /ORGANISM="Pseudo-nitzschia pungens, Strain cf. cingulata" /LENGTH=76 /DNA_ID=CAMNT_0013108325 /DNA_START=577 /DNA_END=807 /DNA_ORIENTATION=-
MTEDGNEGSWTPLLCIIVLSMLWWTSYSQSTRAVRARRWYNTKRVQWKKTLGLRDESIYRDGAAGDGANQKHKRQG